MIRSSSLRQSSPRLPSLHEIKAELARREVARERGRLEVGADTIRARCQTLAGFVREAWHILEPSTAYIHNWHIDAICEHLEAVTSGQINRLLINVPPGPMREDSVVETMRGPILLRDVKVGDLVLTHKGRYRPVEAVHHQGTLPILTITTNSGRITHAAPSHPYLTPRGWVRAGELRSGDVVAVVNPVEDRTAAAIVNPAIARLLGYMVGDGSLTQLTSVFTNANESIVSDFERCCAEAGFKTTRKLRRTHWQVAILGGTRVRAFFAQYGLAGKSSYTKRIPPQIMAASRETMRHFIGAYWSCDGQITVRATRSRGSIYRAACTTVGIGLADDLLYCLGIIGIEGRIRRKDRTLETASQPGGRYVSYNIEVQKEIMTAKFADMPGLCEKKSALARACRASFDQVLWPDAITSIIESEPANCMCLTVAEDHSFVCSGIAVKNSMKSLLVSVFWQAWEWGPKGLTSMRYLSTAFNDGPVIRDASKFLNLITSEWYQALWPEVRLTRTALTKMENSATGDRRAVAFGSLTSQRGDRLVIDDPHSTTTAESDVERNRTTRQFREGALNRLNDHDRSAIVIIMQRLHEDDMAGVILKLKMPFVHLMLPQEFEPERRCSTVIGFADPRTRSGELLDPVRWPQLAWDAFKRQTTAYAVAGQYQQRPAPREGGIFKRHWFSIVDAVPAGASHVRGWDLAASLAETAAFTAGVRLAFKDGIYYVVDVARERGGPADIERLIFNTAVRDTAEVRISIPQDPGQAAKTQVAAYAKLLAGFDVRFSTESKIGGAKEQRAMPVSAQAEVGNVKIIRADWNDDFLDEICSFPNGSFKDQTDALSRAFAMLLADQQSSGANWVEYYRRLSEEANGATVKPEFGYEIAAESDKKYRVRVPDGVTHVYLMDGQPIQVPADHIISVSADDAAALGRRGWERLDI